MKKENCSIGVERERFIVKNGIIVPMIGELLPVVKKKAKEEGIDPNQFSYELESSQIEDRSKVCDSVADLRRSLLENDDILALAAELLELDYEFSEYVEASRFSELKVNSFNERHQILFEKLNNEMKMCAAQVAAIHVHFGVNRRDIVRCLNIQKEKLEYLIKLGDHSNMLRMKSYLKISNNVCFPPEFNSYDEVMNYISSKGGEKNVYDVIRYKPSTETIELRMFGTTSDNEEVIKYVEESANVLALKIR